MVHLAHSRVCRALEEHQALLQQAAVPHLRGNQVGLVAISLLYNALHVGWLQDLQDSDRLDALLNPKRLFQFRNVIFKNLSEMSGDSKQAFLHCGDVLRSKIWETESSWQG